MCREVSVLSVPHPIDVSCDIPYYLFSDRFFSTQEIPIAILSRVRIFVEMLCYVAVYIKM